MKKTAAFLFMFFMVSQTGNCALTNQDINIYNLKQKNMYMLNMDTAVRNIDVSDKNIINVIPVTSIDNNKKQLFIEANETGVCDVILTTDYDTYKIRFISGSLFQDNKSELIQIDMPMKYENGIK